jgi:hypothetical protein
LFLAITRPQVQSPVWPQEKNKGRKKRLRAFMQTYPCKCIQDQEAVVMNMVGDMGQINLSL